MYRKTRTWLTDHFLISDRRIENIYSFSFLAMIAIATIYIIYFDWIGGTTGLDHDVNKVKKIEKP